MKSILIVDDAQFIRYSLKTMIDATDFNVIGEAENGKVAVKLFRQLEPDIVLMDITMPEMDGLEALKEIMKINPRAKVIMISAVGKEEMVRDAVLSGAKGFIVKPFKEETLIKTLEKMK
ncbi:MAG TPA: response regulator [Clostridiales bacterium]|nr:response regulator [Clostridiales bacterium]